MSRKLNLIQGFIKLYEDYLGKTLKIKKTAEISWEWGACPFLPFSLKENQEQNVQIKLYP